MIKLIRGANVNRAYSIDRSGANIVHYWIRDENTKHHIQSFVDKPYFFAKVLKKPIHDDILEVSNESFTTQCGESVKKITVKKPKSVSGYKRYDRKLGVVIKVPAVKGIDAFTKTFEDNIEFPNRCAADHGIKYGMWATTDYITHDEMIGGCETDIMPTVVTLDTEVRTYLYNPFTKIEEKTVEFPDVKEAENEVLSIQCLDNQTQQLYLFRLHNAPNVFEIYDKTKHKNGRIFKNKYDQKFVLSDYYKKKFKRSLGDISQFTIHEHVFADDKSMILYWKKFIIHKDYDIIAAFNGMAFDYPYLFSRMKKLKINYNDLSPLGYVTVRIKGTITKDGYVNETDIRIPGRNLIDTRDLLMLKIYEKRAKNSLDAFSLDFLGVGKAKHDEIKGRKGKKHSIDYEFFEQLEKFKEYANRDVILDYCLQKTQGLWEHYIKLVKTSGCQIFNVTQGRKRVRQTTLFYAKEMGYVLEQETFGSDRFEGARVDNPIITGKLEMSADLDVTSQYPSIIQAYNISWDTLVLDHKFFPEDKFKHIISIEEIQHLKIPYCSHPINGIYFRLDKIGLFPQLITDRRSLRDNLRIELDKLSKAREKLHEGISFDYLNQISKKILIEIGYDSNVSFEDNMVLIDYIRDIWDNDQKVLKVDINTVFGNLPPFLAACVTAGGRELITFTRKVITKLGYPPNYTDTDSVIFKTLRTSVKGAVQLTEWLVDKINIMYKEFEKKYNCIKGWLDIKSEEIYDPIIFIKTKTTGKGAAKTYVKCLVADRGVVLSKPRLQHKGIIKPRQSSVFSVDMARLLIYYCGMNYPNSVTIKRAKSLITKFISGSPILNIPQKELDDMKDKKITLHKGIYTLEEISFPINIRKNWREYKVINYMQKGILKTNEWMHTWSSVVRKLTKGDTAFMVFVDATSKPFQKYYQNKFKGELIKNEVVLPYHRIWAMNGDGELHPDFKVDHYQHIQRVISRYEGLLRAVGINPKVFLMKKGQRTLI